MDPVSQRMMGLRADTTPQVARIAASRLGLQKRPLRLCYAGQVLRVRGSQLDPSRQLPQAGVELIGSDAAAADAEVAVVAVEALAAIGVSGVALDITLPTLAPALFEAAGLEPALRQRLGRALDRKDAAAVAVLAAEAGPLAAALPPLLQAAGPADGALAVLRAVTLPPAAQAIADNAAAVIAAIRGLNPTLRIMLDPAEFRGFRYHNGVAFTLYGPGTTGELARGGRYMAGDEPATGMTLYPDAVLRAAPQLPQRPRLFVPLGEAKAAQALRAQGFATVAALSPADTPDGLRCTHILKDGGAVPLERSDRLRAVAPDAVDRPANSLKKD
jgi:ATP phosphoribosyltransferase regulatory subunit